MGYYCYKKPLGGYRKVQKRKKLVLAAALFAFVGMSGVNTVQACVGRTLNIAYKSFTEQHILAELLGLLIEERTGTKVVLKEFEDTMEAHKAMESNEVQLYVEYTGIGLTDILGMKPIKEPKEVFKAVRTAYEKNFNFIWLKPFGFDSKNEDNESAISLGVPCEAAPVVRKDTLKKYPALARLLNKLNRKMDEEIMGEMVTQVDSGKKIKEVAGEFLAKVGISFSFSPG